MENTQFTYEDAVTKIKSIGGKPIAVEAQWDGDTSGWFLMLFVIVQKGFLNFKKTEVHHLGNLSLGGDIRVFQGTVPPYPEAKLANEIGNKLKDKYGLEFFFPSPIDPDDDCPRWTEKDKAINCGNCKKLIIPTTSPYLPKDICYNCHLKREQNERLRVDEPYDGGVTLYLYKDGEHRNIGYCTNFQDFSIAPYIDHLVKKDEFKELINVVTIQGNDVLDLRNKLTESIEEKLVRYEKPQIEERMERFVSVSKVSFKGVEYELMSRFNSEHEAISKLLHALNHTEHAIKEGYVYRFYFKKGITARDDSILRFVNYVKDGECEKSDVINKYKGILKDQELDVTLKKLISNHLLLQEGSVYRISDLGKIIV